MASKGRSNHNHREAPQPLDGDIARIQMDVMFVGAQGTFVDESGARATVLMLICKDDGNLSATEVRSKTDECGVDMVLRLLRTYESVVFMTDGEPSIVEIARKVQVRRDNQRLWHKRVFGVTKKLELFGTCEWNSAGAVASVLLGRARAYESENHSRHTVVSMDVAALFWNFQLFVSVFHFHLNLSRCCVCCLSIATQQSGDDIHDLGSCHLRF